MGFISYFDDEVGKFHPICERALNKALEKLKLDKNYEVKHHLKYQGIIPDFVIVNKNTGKILIVVEVKRTPSQVMSTRYRLQAQSYISNADPQRFEQTYFALTNLEKTYLFKYTSTNTSVINQVVNPSPINSGNFSDDFFIFEEKLMKDYVNIIQIAFEDSGEYQFNYDDILSELNNYTSDLESWRSALTVIGFELIKSVLGGFQPEIVSSWSHANTYRRNPKVIQNLLNTVDFKSLGENTILNSNSGYWNQSILKKATTIGNRTYSGDEFASVVHDLLVSGHEGEGIVPTDMELAAVLAELVSGEFNNPEEKIYSDPASGSGNLLSAIIDKNPNIEPKRIWANDNLPFLKDILTIRLGLKFSKIINPENAPKITCENIECISKNSFMNIDAIVMNPPYVSGVRDSERKKGFFKRISEVSSKIPITKVGQMPLEGPFLELVIKLAKTGTIIGIIFPEQHLFGKGKESKAIRKLLISEFGLKRIFTYPRDGIFEDVTKGTVILIGEKGSKEKEIEIINSAFRIDEIEIKNLTTENDDIYGVEKRKITRTSLIEKMDEGWKSSMYPSYDVLVNKINSKCSILPKNSIKRGRNDNSGEGKYLYVNKQNYWSSVKNLIPVTWLKEGIQNTIDYEKTGLLIHNNKTPKALCPPKEAFVEGSHENLLLKEIIKIAHKSVNSTTTNGGQLRHSKSQNQILSLLEKVSRKITAPGTILVPRALRKEFKIFETSVETIVSTNFIEITTDDIEKKYIILTWLMSIFGQIQVEMLSKPQEGMRKIEVSEMKMIKFPNRVSTKKVNISELQRGFDMYLNKSDVDLFWMKELNITETDFIVYTNLMAKLLELRNP